MAIFNSKLLVYQAGYWDILSHGWYQVTRRHHLKVNPSIPWEKPRDQGLFPQHLTLGCSGKMAACWNQENLVNPQLVYNNSQVIYIYIVYIYTYIDCILYVWYVCVCFWLVVLTQGNPSQPYARHRDQSSQVTPDQVSIWGLEKLSGPGRQDLRRIPKGDTLASSHCWIVFDIRFWLVFNGL